MFDASLPLLLGTLLALGALSYVLWPLLGTAEEPERRRAVPASAHLLRPDEGLAVAALREIEFDRATGKLSDSDYDELKVKYTTLALAELRKESDTATAIDADEDPVEAAVRAAEARRPRCPQCGPRPESDAIWCSGCGGYLPGACGACGAAAEAAGARFCNRCGEQLTAA